MVPRWQVVAFHELSLSTLYAWMRLRQEVFVREQHSAYVDADGNDPLCHHLLGWWDDRLIAGARLVPPGVLYDLPAIGRVVTHPAARGIGLGRPLMHEAMAAVQRLHGPTAIHLSAQAHLEAFYASLGFVVDGPGYFEDDIPHLPMTAPAPL